MANKTTEVQINKRFIYFQHLRLTMYITEVRPADPDNINLQDGIYIYKASDTDDTWAWGKIDTKDTKLKSIYLTYDDGLLLDGVLAISQSDIDFHYTTVPALSMFTKTTGAYELAVDDAP